MATTLPPDLRAQVVRATEGQRAESATRPAAPAAAGSLADEPGQKSPATERMEAVIKPLRDLLGGITALREAGEDYLPKLPGENQTDFDRRVKLAGFFNTYKRAVKAMAGMIARRDPELQQDAPAIDLLKAHWEAIDDEGNHGAVFARRLCEEAIATGFAGILVDYPTVPDGVRLSVADAQRLNLRPYWVPVTREQVIDADFAQLGAQRVCVYLELYEQATRRAVDGRFGRETVDRYRVYRREVTRDPVTGRVLGVGDPTVQVWERVQGGALAPTTPDPLPLRGKGGAALSAIPFAPMIGGDLTGTDGGWEVEPPLQPLADLCFVWYQIFAERRNVTNRVCSPTLWLAGYVPELDENNQPKPLEIGASRAIQVAQGGQVGYASPPGDGFQPTKDDLEMLASMMASVAMAFLMAETRAAETAEGKRIDAEAQNSGLAAIARAEEDALETAMGFHAEFEGVDPCSITVNRDFETVTADPQLIDALSKLVDSRKMTLERFFMFLDRMLRDGVDRAQELADLKALGPAPVPAAPGQPGVAQNGPNGAPAPDTSVFGRMAQAMAQASGAPTATVPSAPTPPNGVA